jgi:hypothetical protein
LDHLELGLTLGEELGPVGSAVGPPVGQVGPVLGGSSTGCFAWGNPLGVQCWEKDSAPPLGEVLGPALGGWESRWAPLLENTWGQN